MNDRCVSARNFVLCEYDRLGPGGSWLERLELWQLGPTRFLLSVLQVVSEDCGSNEIWISREACDADGLRHELREWSRARRAPADAERSARLLAAAILHDWAPAIGAAFDDELPGPRAAAAASRHD